VLIRDCALRPCGDGHPLVAVNGETVACGGCNETVYPQVLVLAEHDIRCELGVTVWFSRAMDVEVHRCHQPSASVEVEQFLDLAATS
jgi:hypothetical protein